MHVLSVRLREIFLKPAQPVLILHDPSLYRALLLVICHPAQSDSNSKQAQLDKAQAFGSDQPSSVPQKHVPVLRGSVTL